jgi:hypothetical protein
MTRGFEQLYEIPDSQMTVCMSILLGSLGLYLQMCISGVALDPALKMTSDEGQRHMFALLFTLVEPACCIPVVPLTR